MTTPIDFKKETTELSRYVWSDTGEQLRDRLENWAKSIAARVEQETIERCRLEQSHSSTWYEPKLFYSTAPSDAAKGAK